MGIKTLAFTAALLGAGAAMADVSEEETFTFDLASGGRISLDNTNGSILIEGGSTDEVVIRAYKEADDQDDLDEIEISISASDDFIRIETKLGDDSGGWWGGDNGNKSVDYEITVPADVVLDTIESVNGNVEISGVLGKVKAETVNGSVEVSGLSSDASLETVNGSISAEFVVLSGDQRVDAESVNGKITLFLPANADARISAETVNGSINGKDFGLKTDDGFVGEDLDGEIGDGSARVKAGTVNGGIRIRKN